MSWQSTTVYYKYKYCELYFSSKSTEHLGTYYTSQTVNKKLAKIHVSLSCFVSTFHETI